MTLALITETDANPGEAGYLAGQLSADGVKVLRTAGPEITDGTEAPVQILVPFVATQVTAEVVDRLPQLGLIVTRSTGTDHIDVAEAARRGITIASVPDYGSVAVAEHTFALLLTLTRIQPHLVPGTDLSGKTLGVNPGEESICQPVTRAEPAPRKVARSSSILRPWTVMTMLAVSAPVAAR